MVHLITMQVRIDGAGRIVLPKAVRDELQLMPGDSLDLERSANGVTLRPAAAHVSMRTKDGVYVFRSGEPLTAESAQAGLDALRQGREKRARSGADE